MTIIDEEEKLGSIDSMFDDDHFVCCRVEDRFSGVTTGFCGASVILDGSDQEWVDEVSCKKCNDIVESNIWHCPLGYDCENT